MSLSKAEAALTRAHPTPGDDTFLDCGPSRMKRIFDPRLLLFHLDLGRRAYFDDSDTAGQLGYPLLQLLPVVLRAGLFDLLTNRGNARLDVFLDASPIDNGGVLLADKDALGFTEIIESNLVELQANFLGDDSATGENSHVLQHRLAAITKTGRL